MSRLIPSLIALLAAGALTAPALAADIEDWGDDPGLRDGYSSGPGDWVGLDDKTDPVRFEFGLRYWYSMGAASWSDTAGTFTSTDTSHSVEAHLRIEDHSTNAFATALAGYSFKMDGSYSDPFDSGSVVDGKLAYIGGDIGWNPLTNGQGSGLGPVLGYMYWNDSANTNRSGYTTATSASQVGWNTTTGETSLPFDSQPNNIDIHLLRLGVQAKGDMGFFDITGSVAAVPYAKVSGILGNDQTTTVIDNSVFPGGNIVSVKASPTAIDGWGYGGMADVMMRVHPTQNWSIGIGGRAWYLQGTADATYDQATISNPSDVAAGGVNYDTGPTFSKQTFIEVANPFSLFRYGLLAEATYAF